MEFVLRLSPSYLNFTVPDIYSFASFKGMVLNSKECEEMCICFLQYCSFSPANRGKKVSNTRLREKLILLRHKRVIMTKNYDKKKFK